MSAEGMVRYFGSHRRPLGVALVATLLAACAATSGDTAGGQKTHHRQPGEETADRSGGERQDRTAGRGDPYEKALLVKAKDGCPAAIPLLEPLAALGRGHEMAQFQLGACYLETARAQPAERVDEKRALGAGWILKAANSEVPDAQETAVRLYLDGIGIAADPAEAGKWFLLLQRNPRRTMFGPTAMDADLEKRLRRDLSDANWGQARIRADQWQPVQQPSAPQQPRQAPRPS
jgi:TPR repeat protein